ncbi:carboxypeptidase regulatory-like domain-containing protein [Natrinema salsiterrestre]|uniref:Carboxypeptidase regulatory-like domain-containing protein n=1 Tax=Natrinema salsiterrestre TaxID=2950540 RepID=A0A9Q4L6G0_9EURY|nr:carboxypeptidase regulatory-like domain-containing protein [Natrinema salsiterrestre]MDF9747778.1 carboxypeptidase regulatory-like domain-containing protein [Natrinema salsiterrestre]
MGDEDHTFYVGYTVHGPDGDSYDNNGTTGTPVSIDAGGWDVVTLEWEVEDDAPEGSYDVQVSVWKENDPNELYTRLADEWADNAFDLREEELEATITDVNSESGTFTEGDIVTTTADVENTGNTDHTFYVGYTVHGPDGDSYDNNETTGTAVSIDAGGWDGVTLEWEVEDDAPEGSYDVQVSVWKESDPNALYTRLADEWVDNAFDLEEEELEATITDVNSESGTYAEGDVVTTTVDVENTGNTDHTFYVGYTVHGPDGGAYDNDETTGTTVALDGGSKDYVDVAWEVEPDAPEGTYDVRVSVWEESDPDALYTRLDDAWVDEAFELEAEERSEIDAAIANVNPELGTYAEGDVVTTTVDVENTGTADHTFYVGYTVHGPDGREYDNDGSTGGGAALDAGTSVSIPLEWEVEPDAPEGTYDVQVSIWEERDPDELYTRLADERVDDAFELEETDDEIDATIAGIDVDSGVFDSGDVVTASVDIENTGETVNTFFVGYTPHGPDGDEYDNDETTGTTVSLEGGATEAMSLEWEVEDDAPEGSYDVQVSVWEESDPDELNTRLADELVYDAFEVLSGEIDAEIYTVELPSRSEPYAVGDLVTTAITLENTGDESRRFVTGFTVEEPTQEFSAESEVAELNDFAPDLMADVNLEWEVPDGAPEGTYDIHLFAEAASEDGADERVVAESTEESAFEVAGDRRASVTIRTDDMRGEPVSGSRVRVRAVSDDFDDTRETGPNGEVRFTDVPTGEYDVTASSEERHQEEDATVSLTGGENRRVLTFDPVDDFTGIVLSESGHRTIPNAEVSIPELDESTRADDLGRFELGSLVPDGPYEIVTRDENGELIQRGTLRLSIERTMTIRTNQMPEPLDDETLGEYLEEENDFLSAVFRNVDLSEITLSPVHSRPEQYGEIKGSIAALRDTLEGIEDFLSALYNFDLGEFIDALETAYEIVSSEPEIIAYLIYELAAALEDDQREDNPFEEETRFFRAFRIGWYRYYVATTLVIEFAVGKGIGKATDVAKSSARLSRATDEFSTALSRIEHPKATLQVRQIDLATLRRPENPARKVGIVPVHLHAQYQGMVNAVKYVNRRTKGSLSASFSQRGELAERIRAAQLLRERDIEMVVPGPQNLPNDAPPGLYLIPNWKSGNQRIGSPEFENLLVRKKSPDEFGDGESEWGVEEIHEVTLESSPKTQQKRNTLNQVINAAEQGEDISESGLHVDAFRNLDLERDIVYTGARNRGSEFDDHLPYTDDEFETLRTDVNDVVD